MAGLYIHIPFCHAKCAYCDFYSVAGNKNYDNFLHALKSEFNGRRSETNEPFRTIYLGGGTPSSLGTERLANILEWIPTDEATEITIEVNPEDVTDHFARFLSESVINRVSMGVQSLDDAQLSFIGRRHKASEATVAYHRLRNAGIENISLDLIFGLPGQDLESWNNTLSGIIALEPNHLSAYSLMLEPGTRLWAMKKSGRFVETDDETVARMYHMLCEKASNAGFEHYEISNFAQPGKKSLHNSSYWNLTPYIGLGPGAHSYDGSIRRFNPWKLKDYIDSNGMINQVDEEDFDNIVNDYIMIRLRTAEGLSINDTASRFSESVARKVLKNASRSIHSGNIVCENNTLRIPESKWLVSDPIISDIFI